MPNVTVVPGGFDHLPADTAGEAEVIVHGAAETGFGVPLDVSRATNLGGTEKMLAFARRCPRLRQFVHLSTCCVCGAASGIVPESPLPKPAAFINSYEQSKWEAEQAVLASGLPHRIVRLSIVAGSEADGRVRRPGALHHALLWLYRGLIPMMPGTPEAPVDLISSEFAAACIAEAVNTDAVPGPVVHAALGDRAPRLGELLGHLTVLFRADHRGWRSGNIVPPDVVDAETFALFERSARLSGDLLLQRVCQDAQSFLPGLLFPRTYAAEKAARERTVNWRRLTENVFLHLKHAHWPRTARAAA
jgi:nucleoside-diphosphate-sugar epimerase